MARDLPFDIWYRIGHDLAEDGSRRDLASLRLVDRLCYSVATPLLYRSLRLEIEGVKSIQNALPQLQDGGLGCHYLRYARQLFVRAETMTTLRCEPNQRRVHKWGVNCIHPLVPAREGGLIESRLTESRVPDIGIPSSFNGSWEPLASLITRLHYLESLDFSAPVPFPAGLHDALSRHPNCQLNVWAVQAVGYSEMARDKDPDSICRLLRFSGLRTLSIDVTWRNATVAGWVNLNDQLPFLFVAPNLKNLVLYAARLHKYHLQPHANPRWGSFTNQWRDLAARFEHAAVPVLDTLTLSGAHESLLLRLSEALDLSSLRTLDIHAYHEVELLKQIATAFPRLQRLLITVNPLQRPEALLDDKEAISAITLFPSLEFLSLRGLRDGSNLFEILQRHGRSLRGLILEPTPDRTRRCYEYPRFTPSDIIHLAETSPHLEDLQIQCVRSKGSKAECGFYKALGHFQSLHSLVLDLDCNMQQATPQTATATQIQILKDGFINAAVDTKLALQVFSLITANQPSGRLRKLRLAPFSLRASELDHLQHNHYLAKQVLVSRFPLRVEEIAKQEWEAFNDAIKPNPRSLPGWLESILDEILPSVPGKEPWWDRYESVPLDVDGILQSIDM